MYNHFKLVTKYIYYYLNASNGKGHGIHSPFVFDFINNVLNDKKSYPCFSSIENLRQELLHDKRVIVVEDFGAGSLTVPFKQKKVSDITRAFLKPKKYAKLLFRIVKYYQPKTIVELGTSFGITTCYIAAANKDSEVYTFEGSKNTAAIAGEIFKKLQLHNVKIIQENFDDTLSQFLEKSNTIDFVFVDGNHKKIPTLNYFNQLLNHSTELSILIFDDIHWSKEMEEAWKEIQQHQQVTLTIDLFFIGIVFLKKDFKAKQHFTIRF